MNILLLLLHSYLLKKKLITAPKLHFVQFYSTRIYNTDTTVNDYILYIDLHVVTDPRVTN